MSNHLHDDEMGFDLDFIIDPIEDVGSSIVDRLESVVKAIPGGEWIVKGVGTVGGVVGDFVSGPLRDFANTAIGESIFRAFSIVISQALYVLPVVGYTLGFLAWSIPGLAKGQGFEEALVTETAYRIEKIIEYFAGDVGGKMTEEGKKYYNDTLSEEIRNAVESISVSAEEMGISPQQWLEQNGMTPGKLAAVIGTREDMAAVAIGWFKGSTPDLDAYDLKTGKLLPTLGKRKKPTGVVSKTAPIDPCTALANAKKSGQKKPIIDALTKKCADYRKTKTGAKMTGVTGMVSSALKALSANSTLGKRKKPTGQSAGPSNRTPCEIYEAAKRAGQKPVILAPLKAKCDAYSAEMAARQATLAASAAVATAPVTMGPAADASADSESNKKSAIAGVVSGFVGTGGAMLAGLSAGVAIPVGLGFAAGGAIATKLISKFRGSPPAAG